MKTLIKYVKILIVSTLIVGCTIVPKPVTSNTAAFDSSTPQQYNNQNSGFIGFSNGYAIITENARAKYNSLIEKYSGKFEKEKAVKLSKDQGITPWKDQFGNSLYIMDKQHLSYFLIMSSWLRSNVAP